MSKSTKSSTALNGSKKQSDLSFLSTIDVDSFSYLHQFSSEHCDWKEISESEPPLEPKRDIIYEINALHRLNSFKPTFFQKLFFQAKKRRNKILQKVEKAKLKDDEFYKNALINYDKKLEIWHTKVELAKRILQKDLEAFKEAINFLDPYSQILKTGIWIETSVCNTDKIIVNLHINSVETAANEGKKTVKDSGTEQKKITLENLTKATQKHICSAVFRAARDSFATLPVDTVCINFSSKMIDGQAYYWEDIPIISVILTRTELESLDFENINILIGIKDYVGKTGCANSKSDLGSKQAI